MKVKDEGYTVTSFILKEGIGQLSNRRVLFHIKKRLGICDNIFQKTIGFLPPVSVALCPTPKCTRSCVFCSNTIRNKKHLRRGVSYNDEFFSQIVSDLNEMGVEGVTIAGGGEPMTYKGQGLWNLLLNKQSFQVGLHTNGSAVPETRLKDLVSSPCLRYVNLSFVAHTQKLYTEVTRRGTKQFKIIERFLLEYPTTLKDEGSLQEFSVKVLICRENYRHINEMINYLKGLGIANILLRCVANFEKDQDTELNQKQKTELRDILQRINIPLAQINMILGIAPVKLPIPKRCWINTLMYTAGVDPDGEVYLCSPYSFLDYSIGNVNEASFRNLWGGKEHLKAIDLLNRKCISGECDPLSCRHYYSNLAVDAFLADKIPALNEKDLEKNYGMFI